MKIVARWDGVAAGELRTETPTVGTFLRVVKVTTTPLNGHLAGRYDVEVELEPMREIDYPAETASARMRWLLEGYS